MTPTIHPELQALMHHLTPEARAQLEANLLADGVRDPLVVWQEEGVLLDGHNRLQVCTQHDLPYSVYEISLPSLNAAKLWVLANQLGRRNNTPEQTSYYLGKQYQLQKQMGFKGNQHTRADGNGYQKQTAAQGLAAQHKVAEKTIRNHDAYAKAIDTLSDTIDPAIGPAVLAREITLTQQDVRTLAKIAETDTWTTRHALDRVKHASTPKQVRAVVREAAREARQHQQELQKVADSHITGEIPEADWPERIKRKYLKVARKWP